MDKKQFQAESKRLLDLMINSIYTNREIFLREIISNASDAMDKIYYKALTDESLVFNKDDYYIKIHLDEENRTLTVSDTGIGMTSEELENNLGVIAKSGSFEFKKNNELKDDYDIIGQFGVGFYSAFMVAKKVTVVSRAFGSDKAYKWESTGADGYTVEECSRERVGTDVIMEVKENTDVENYDEFLKEYRLREIVKKYSDYIRYPIKMDVKKTKPIAGEEDKVETYEEEETINSMIPIWRKNKSELTDEDYTAYYHERRFGFDDPVKHIHLKIDGSVSYNAILYIPSTAPFDFYTKDFEKGLELYSNGVLIMSRCAELLPDYFSFVKGVVDSEDLSLNISRETLQHTRQLQLIAKKIEEKVKDELLALLDNDRKKYTEFFKSFGKQLKYGVYSGFGMNKTVLQDLLLFYSSARKEEVTLKEYVKNMKEDQKFIYYAAGDSVENIDKLPQTEVVKEKGYEILYLTDEVDEFALKMLGDYAEKEFRSVSSDDLGIDEEEQRAESEKLKKENKNLFQSMKEFLGNKVVDVRPTNRLKTHPVCLASEGDLSIEMEKILSTMPNNERAKAKKILEINPNHQVFQALQFAEKSDREKLKLYTELLYNQALLIEGLPIEDPVAFTNDICKLM